MHNFRLPPMNLPLLSLLTALMLVVTLAAATPSLAADLDALRAQGKVGERFDGLAVALDPSAKATVDSVNKKRLAIYQEDAQQQGVSVEAVGSVYAPKIMQQAPKGTKFQQANGKWVTK